MTTVKPQSTIAPGETRVYPVLPLRDIVAFPHVIVPLFVGREKSIRALKEVMRNNTYILLATQKNASDDDPSTDSIYEVGTLARVLQLLKLPDGTVRVLVEGAKRARILEYTDRTDYYEANAVVLEDTVGEREAKALVHSVVTEFEGYVKLNLSAWSSRSTITAASPTWSPRTWRSKSPTNRVSSRPPRSASGWRGYSV